MSTPLETRTEVLGGYSATNVTQVNLMEDAGWAVRQVEVLAGGAWVVVYERERPQ